MESRGSVSREGSRIAFAVPADPQAAHPQLYLRRDGASTAWVSQSEATTPVAKPSNVAFLAMTPDGKKIVFATADKLLDSDPGGAQLAPV